jgi:protein O-GlcNAc transferase
VAIRENKSTLNISETHARILQFLQTAQYAEAEKLCAWLIDESLEAVFEPHFYLGVALQFQGKVPHALEVFKFAHGLSPQNVDVMQAIASCLDQLQQYDEAYHQLMLALAIVPQDSNLNANIGAILEKLKKPEEALKYYDVALRLNPKNLTALLNRGSLLATLGRKSEGLVHCQTAYQIHPQVIGTLYNLADALLGLFRYKEALHYCNAGLLMQPRHANLLFMKGLLLSCLRRFDEARSCLAEAQVLDPKVVENTLPYVARMGPHLDVILNPQTLYLDAMYQAQAKCFWEYRADFIAEWQRAILNPYNPIESVSNFEFGFQILSLPLSAEARLKLSKNMADWVQEMAWLQAVPPFSYEPIRNNKIRIGYFSSDFRVHPTGLLSKQIYGLHNKAEFEIYAYSTFNAEVKDHVRQSVEEGCNVFRDVSLLSDRKIAELIHQDEIEILVDLNGYTAKARPMVIAFHPAPIQVSYLAYIQSMGADFIDYSIIDSHVCPVENEWHWHEAIVRLPHSLYVYDTETDCLPTHKMRKDYALPEDTFVFCCLNNCYKIEPDIFDVWMNILLEVPDSVLWLLVTDELAQFNLKNEANIRGVAKERIIFATTLPHSEHLLRYQLADLFIDTFWYGAHTTGLDALWQNLPVLTCMGDNPVSRVGASLLESLELPELIANDFLEYKQKAIYYAKKPLALAELKRKLKQKKMTAPLFNTEQTVKHIESAYKIMSQRYRAGNSPITFDVPYETVN